MILKKEYIIKNLHCTNCASKIEANIKKMNIVSDANIDFYTGKLTLTLKEETDDEPFIKKLSFICDKIEPGTFVKTIDYIEEDSSPLEELSNIDEEIIKDEDSEENRKEHIKELIINSGLIVSIFIFLISFFIDSNFNKNLLLVIAYFLSATDILIISLKNIKRGNFLDENFLMSIATIGAFALGDFSEAVAVMIFYKIGEFFQEKAVANSKKSIEKLLSLKANYANLKTSSGELKKVSPETVKIGEIITIKTGEKIPLDGTVVLGESLIDNSALTGESIPVSVKVGTTILSGGILLGSSIDVEVISVYSDSTVSKIIELVKNANSRKPESEKFITKFARFYTPTVVALSVIIAIFPPFILDQPFTIWFGRALIFLVISCPCALVLSIPLTFFSSIGYASKNGLLIKGGNYLEKISKIDTIVFDKTGTITKGNFKVDEIILNNCTEEQLILCAKAAEYLSNHPIAKAILDYESSPLNKEAILNHEEIPGRGVSVQYMGDEILVGNYLLLREAGIEITPYDTFKTAIYVARNGIYLGIILITDQIKDGASETIKSLKELGINLYMLTGDSNSIAKNVGEKVGLNPSNIFSSLLPQDKVEHLEKIKSKSKNGVIFVGDGINDAPVLALADVGVAMGGIGSDIAIESSDVVIMNDEFEKINTLILLAKKNKKILIENIILALGIKIIVMILGVLGYANLWLAIFADVGVSILAILNASKILNKK